MSSGFITETEAAEARKRRQEEWEKVRNATDPLERPEEPFDSRSLYERLQEQKQKKDLEYEEAHKLKNMIKGLDDDEIEFLDLVDRTKLAADRKKNMEEEKELNDYRNRVATLQEKSLEEKIHSEINVAKPKLTNNRTSQTQLLKGVVVKKTDSRKRKIDTEETSAEDTTKIENVKPETKQNDIESKHVMNAGLTCIGILPGLGYYNDSSSDSSDIENESPVKIQTDILGRKIIKKEKS